MMSGRAPLITGLATALGLGGSFSYFVGGIVSATPQAEWLDNTILACLPALLFGVVAGHLADRGANLWQGSNHGFVLIDLASALKSWAGIPLAVAFYWSRPMFALGCVILLGALYSIRHAIKVERERLNDLAAN